MAESFPPDLAELLRASDAAARERAWERFLAARSALLLHTARSLSASQDSTMEAYAFMLDGLRANDFRRLREYRHRPHAQFTTWLVLVARRLCIDHDRSLHGRAPAEDDSDQMLQRQARRRLAELAAEEVDLDSIAAESGATPEHQVRQFELKQALEQALGTLDHRDRLLLTYRYVDKLSAQEIARLQQWPSHLHVYRRITHVCGLLRRELERRGVESSVP
ncbi:MAG TPA: sigma-70 family RNA polymerase sigma factor [Gemmatimonadaceae bacterium]